MRLFSTFSATAIRSSLLGILISLLAFGAKGGTVTVNSNSGTFSAVITVTATSLNKTANWTANFNYSVNLSYDIKLTGSVPPGFSFYNIAGTITTADGTTGFQLPNSGGSGTVTTYTQTHANYSDYATATPSSLGATQAYVSFSGNDISASNIGVNIASSPSALPIFLKSFSAAPVSGGVSLAWATAQETQSGDFSIERSTDGQHWAALTSVAAKGSASAGASYSYKDLSPAAGNNYYRLAQNEADGSVTYSNTLEVHTNTVAKSGLQVFPNPNTGNSIRISGLDNDGNGQLWILSASGQAIGTVSVSNGQATLPELPTGLYFLHVAGVAGNEAIPSIRYYKN